MYETWRYYLQTFEKTPQTWRKIIHFVFVKCLIPEVRGVLPTPTFGGKSISTREVPVIPSSRRTPTPRKQVKPEIPSLQAPRYRFPIRSPSRRASVPLTRRGFPPALERVGASSEKRTLNSNLTPTMGMLSFGPRMNLPALEKDEWLFFLLMLFATSWLFFD